MSQSPSEDSAVAEKQLLELEALLSPRLPSSGRRPQPMVRARSAVAALWRPNRSPRATSPAATEEKKLATLPPAPQSTSRVRNTAYLDGLRGFAALLVYSLHHEIWAHPGVWKLEEAFGWDGNYNFVCFPGIRVFFSGGHTAVAVFFIISGYVLSCKPLAYIHSRDSGSLADSLGSALFRRWLRLYIPVAATTFVFMTSWHLFGIRSASMIADAPESNYFAEIWKWYCDFKNYSFVFGGEASNHYNDHTWSIPMEFKGSIAVYTTLLALARTSTQTRLFCEAGLIWYFLYIVDGWFCALFMAGMLFCDLDMLASKGRLPNIVSRWNSIPKWATYLMVAISLYLGGVPSIKDDVMHLRQSPGWYLLSFLKPQAVYDVRWFFRFWAALFAMIAIPRLNWLKSFFETRFCQYLGRISFSLYLVHGPILWTIGDRIYAATGRVAEAHLKTAPAWINLFPFPGWGPLGLEVNYLIAHLILLPITLLLAELSTKFFDEPSVRFSQWLFGNSLDSEAQTSPLRMHTRQATI